MTIKTPSFTVGVEEEYLLVDPKTLELVTEPPDGLLRDCERAVPAEIGTVSPEFLRPQIEVDTAVCADIAEVREKLAALRRIVAGVAEGYGCRIIAASTHPTARGTNSSIPIRRATTRSPTICRPWPIGC